MKATNENKDFTRINENELNEAQGGYIYHFEGTSWEIIDDKTARVKDKVPFKWMAKVAALLYGASTREINQEQFFYLREHGHLPE